MAFKERLTKLIDAYETGLPEKFREDIDPQQEVLDKETFLAQLHKDYSKLMAVKYPNIPGTTNARAPNTAP